MDGGARCHLPQTPGGQLTTPAGRHLPRKCANAPAWPETSGECAPLTAGKAKAGVESVCRASRTSSPAWCGGRSSAATRDPRSRLLPPKADTGTCRVPSGNPLKLAGRCWHRGHRRHPLFPNLRNRSATGRAARQHGQHDASPLARPWLCPCPPDTELGENEPDERKCHYDFFLFAAFCCDRADLRPRGGKVPDGSAGAGCSRRLRALRRSMRSRHGSSVSDRHCRGSPRHSRFRRPTGPLTMTGPAWFLPCVRAGTSRGNQPPRPMTSPLTAFDPKPSRFMEN